MNCLALFNYYLPFFLFEIMTILTNSCISAKNITSNKILSEEILKDSMRALPFINQTLWEVISTPIGDYFQPGHFNLQQSALPMYIVIFNVIGNAIAFIVFLYFWKQIYYQVPDPYATHDGPAPPQLKSDDTDSLLSKVLQALEANF